MNHAHKKSKKMLNTETLNMDRLKKRAKMEVPDNIINQFKPNVPLSAKTLKKRTGYSHKYILGAMKVLVEDGKIRRVIPSEVGSNKFSCNWCLPETHESYITNLMLERHENIKYGDKKRRPPVSRRFHVFVLT